jgi:hypothetical protein
MRAVFIRRAATLTVGPSTQMPKSTSARRRPIRISASRLGLALAEPLSPIDALVTLWLTRAFSVFIEVVSQARAFLLEA